MTPAPAPHDTAFGRLWHGFLTARAMIALALLVLQLVIGLLVTQQPPVLPAALCMGYLVVTVAARLKGRQPPRSGGGWRWLPTVGTDLLVFTLLPWIGLGALNYAPLLALPILMAAVLGSLRLALATAAAVSLLQLGEAVLTVLLFHADPAPRLLQAALSGAGYFAVAALVQQLAARLVHEEQSARGSASAAALQAQVNELVIETLGDGVLVLDEQTQVHAANPAAHRLLEVAAARLPLSLDAAPWQPLAVLARATFLQSAPQVAEVALLQAAQRPLRLQVRTRLAPAPSPAAAGLCVMFLQDLRELEARMRTEKLAAMGRMSAAVAHEIRNPLAAIVQANALLAEELGDPAQQRLSAMVEQNARRLQHIADEVLDIARVQHQIGHTPASTVALDETVAQVLRDWQAQAPARRRVRLRAGAPQAQVEFDAEHLRRVLVNLLDNALRYAGTSDDAIQVSTQATPPGPARLAVWSDGAPLERGVERHLFEPFFSSESRSSGLGLFLCRELCQRHGAAIAYQRIDQQTALGLRGGNAFSVAFRNAGGRAHPDPDFDVLVV
ncbi:ATP-binding protein [Xylophilus sp.]|uniref:ATP-binding protein n=1 Tax=Xylophilus sp. TaxID=2653893 RepID=UPI0013BDF3BE|nr:ATP-binding protein [Xylophilus sp.]KAF1048578.1 MAG: Signal transduction histidine-protein kinase AtoS [Xylophilus sp.]